LSLHQLLNELSIAELVQHSQIDFICLGVGGVGVGVDVGVSVSAGFNVNGDGNGGLVVCGGF